MDFLRSTAIKISRSAGSASQDPAFQRTCTTQSACEASQLARAFGCPWQNDVAERWLGSCRRDLLGHVIILNERHLKRLLSSYLLYHEDRTHLGLAKDTPAGRATENRSAGESKIQSFPRLSGLHHRYAVAA